MNQMCFREADKHILPAREIFQLDFSFTIINHLKLPLIKSNWTFIIIIIITVIIIVFNVLLLLLLLLLLMKSKLDIYSLKK